MINIRRNEARGTANHGWLDTKYTFSFSQYYDPAFMGFGNLRVINEDVIAAAGGFQEHGHRDMEIITVVLEGALSHKDSIGNTSTILPGDVQRMSAGKGILHSEFNGSDKNPVHLLQIWILPELKSVSPSYAQKNFPYDDKKVTLLASKTGRDGSITMNQDVDLYRVNLAANQNAELKPYQAKSAWVQIAKGSAVLNGAELKQGDGAAIKGEEKLQFSSKEGAEILVFDLKE